MPIAERMPFTDLKNVSPDHLLMIEYLQEAESSTPETNWREYGPEDYRFYAGDQDTAEVKAILEEMNRPDTTWNEVKPKIDMLIGLAAQTRFEPSVNGVSAEDAALEELMQGVMKHYAKKLKLSRKEVECFEHTAKSGRSLLYFYVDKENPFKAKIMSKRIPGYSFYLDPNSIEYDMADARYLFLDKWVEESAVKALWPSVDVNVIQQHNVTSGYPSFFNEDNRLYRVVEGWYRKWEDVIWFVNPMTGKEEWLRPDEFSKFQKALGELSEGKMQIEEFVKQAKLNVHYMIFTDIYKIEGGPSPFKWKGFPAVLFGGYKNEDTNTWFSAIRMMIDPQVALNTMRRQLLHLLQTLPKGILKHEVGSILNLNEYETRSADPSFHLEVAKGQFDKVGFEKQPQISMIYREFDGALVESLKNVSGIQNEMMGLQTTSREPGITVRMRQNAGLAVLYLLFDNFSESRLEAARVLLSFIQQFCTEQELVRIQGAQGQQLMEVNSQMNPQVQGFNDLSAGEYDLEASETLDNATMRLTVAQILTDFSQNNPNSIPPDIILEYANMPFSVKERVRESWEASQRATQENLDAERALKLVELSMKTGIEEKKIVASVEAAKRQLKEAGNGNKSSSSGAAKPSGRRSR